MSPRQHINRTHIQTQTHTDTHRPSNGTSTQNTATGAGVRVFIEGEAVRGVIVIAAITLNAENRNVCQLTHLRLAVVETEPRLIFTLRRAVTEARG